MSLASARVIFTGRLPHQAVIGWVAAARTFALPSRLAEQAFQMTRASCRFECHKPVFIAEEVLAEHLYRLAQEAVTNAIKHGRASNIAIRLAVVKRGGVLTIRDDGCGFDVVSRSQSGLGLRIMNYRAKMIGGLLNVRSSLAGGTVVNYLFPIGVRLFEGSNAH